MLKTRGLKKKKIDKYHDKGIKITTLMDNKNKEKTQESSRRASFQFEFTQN